MARVLLFRSVSEESLFQGLLLSLLKNGHTVTWDREDSFPAYRGKSFDVVFLPSGGYAAGAIAALTQVAFVVVLQRNHILHTLAEVVYSSFLKGPAGRRLVIWAVDPVQGRCLSELLPCLPVILHPLAFAGRCFLQVKDGQTYEPRSYSITGYQTEVLARNWANAYPEYRDKFVFLGSPPLEEIEVHYSQLGLNRRLDPQDLPLPAELRACMEEACSWRPGDPIRSFDERACLTLALQGITREALPSKADTLRLVVYAAYLRHLLLVRRKAILDALRQSDDWHRFMLLGSGWGHGNEAPGTGFIRNRMKLYAVAGCVVDLGSTFFGAGWYNRPYEVAQFGNAMLQVDGPAPAGPADGFAFHLFDSVDAFSARLSDLAALQDSWIQVASGLTKAGGLAPSENGKELMRQLETLQL